MIQNITEQSLTELAQRFNAQSTPNYAVLRILRNKESIQYTYSDGSVYVGKAVEALRNKEGHSLGFSKGIPFVRTTKRRHEK